ncbi:MAG: tetratricopeptide repeat protein [Cyanobacteria bacterium P01_A01_bin.84]
MDSLFINSLLKDLKNPDETIRDNATRKLWRVWFKQKGVYGLGMIERSQKLLDSGQIDAAKEILVELIRKQPDFAEAWNRRAFLYYSIGDYHNSLADCQMAIRLNSVHFGALHGMGLCYAAIGNYSKAIKAFQRALEIQPYSLVNQKLILECNFRLSK